MLQNENHDFSPHFGKRKKPGWVSKTDILVKKGSYSGILGLYDVFIRPFVPPEAVQNHSNEYGRYKLKYANFWFISSKIKTLSQGSTGAYSENGF